MYSRERNIKEKGVLSDSEFFMWKKRIEPPGEAHPVSGTGCRGRSWMVNAERWCCCRCPVSLGSCSPVSGGKRGALCWLEGRIQGRWRSGACAGRSAVEGCGNEATLYALR